MISNNAKNRQEWEGFPYFMGKYSSNFVDLQRLKRRKILIAKSRAASSKRHLQIHSWRFRGQFQNENRLLR